MAHLSFLWLFRIFHELSIEELEKVVDHEHGVKVEEAATKLNNTFEQDWESMH